MGLPYPLALSVSPLPRQASTALTLDFVAKCIPFACRYWRHLNMHLHSSLQFKFLISLCRWKKLDLRDTATYTNSLSYDEILVFEEQSPAITLDVQVTISAFVGSICRTLILEDLLELFQSPCVCKDFSPAPTIQRFLLCSLEAL